MAELLGTFLFFAIGLSSVQAVGALTTAAPLLVVVPFAIGFGLLAAIFAFGHISGGHFNPAVRSPWSSTAGRPRPMPSAPSSRRCSGAIGSAVLVLLLWNQAAVAGTITAPGTGFTDPRR